MTQKTAEELVDFESDTMMLLDKNGCLLFWERGRLLSPKFSFSQAEQRAVFSITSPMIRAI